MSNSLVFTPNPALHAFPERESWSRVISGINHNEMNSIEQGYFVFTMMPSLRCSLNCPHCYLTLDQRRNSEIMSLESMELAFSRVSDYFNKHLADKPKIIVFYWYGGEPTEMGLPYFLSATKLIDRYFPESQGYYIRHDILTSLIAIEDHWFDFFHTYGRGQFQTSFDGLMRGKGYVKRWDKRVREALARDLRVSTISVVNHELFQDGPEAVLDYLTELGIQEASFLPFMLNEQNRGDKYEKYAPPMREYSQFMIRLTQHWIELKRKGLEPPMIGQTAFILSRMSLPPEANVAGQTLFLLPNGDFVLPDYKDGWLEFMQPFGNILKQRFEEVLSSPARRRYLRRQYQGNLNAECLSCSHKRHCIMEFWKENRPGDDCFGAKDYVEWVVSSPDLKELLDESQVMAS